MKKFDGSKSYTVEWDDSGTQSSLWSESEVAWGVVLFQSIGLEISKTFDTESYIGQVVDVSSEDDDQKDLIYRIFYYKDGDSEDFDELDLEEGRKLHQKEKKQKTKRKQPETLVEEEKKEEEESNNGGRRRRSTKVQVSYIEVDEDSMDLDSDEKEVRQSRKRLKPSTKKLKTTSKKHDDDFEAPDEQESDSDLDDDMIVDDDGEGEDEVKPKQKPVGKKRAAAKKEKKSKVKEESDNDVVDDEFQTRLITERNRVKPNNNPQKWPVYGSYVDPVGVDPTHGIVERIVSDQVRKVGGLLQQVQVQKSRKSKDDVDNRELSYPIRLQTACSGTDAPSIALGLIKESLSRLCSKSNENKDHLFDYEHMMSCEIEPFKQAYIARNFPGVPLFPDITKLSAIDENGKGDKVVDVYGRPQYIPEGELFVAGTSCKDFSMLKTTRRKDIQDKGQSGETFLAAVEFLDLHQPPFAIFENVDGAPWGKMQEYIQGRIYLADRNVNKAIASTKRKDSKFCSFLCVLNIFEKKAY